MPDASAPKISTTRPRVTPPTPKETVVFEAGGVAALLRIAQRLGLMELIDEVEKTKKALKNASRGMTPGMTQEAVWNLEDRAEEANQALEAFFTRRENMKGLRKAASKRPGKAYPSDQMMRRIKERKQEGGMTPRARPASWGPSFPMLAPKRAQAGRNWG